MLQFAGQPQVIEMRKLPAKQQSCPLPHVWLVAPKNHAPVFALLLPVALLFVPLPCMLNKFQAYYLYSSKCYQLIKQLFFHPGSSWLNYSYPSVPPVRMKLSCLFWLNYIYIYINSPIINTCSLGHFGGDSLDHHHSSEGATWGNDQIHPDELVF